MKTTEHYWKLYEKDLRYFVFSKINDRDLCNDILQDTFLKFHLNKDIIREESKIKAWLLSVARNMVMDHFRKRRPEEPVNDIADESKETKEKGFSDCVIPHINKLPGKYREAIQAVEMEGMSQKEFAERNSMSHSGAKSRVQRARELLRSYFEACCDVVTDKYGNVIEHHRKQKCSMC